jgi:geranylgeranyl pyrophosphate synthase
MKKPTEVLSIFENYTSKVDQEIETLLKSQKNLKMYDMMSYFFGYKDEELKDVKSYAGKRFRSGLCLILAHMYEVSEKALEVASAIEVFHNFTLIHDDIEDNDPLRRGRPTVWKLWGLNHGINTGDAQLILANLELIKGISKNNLNPEIQTFLNEKFLEVIEGQFMDFTLTDLSISDKLVTVDNYLEMIKNKSSVLIGAATKAAGLVAALSEKEIESLWNYGLNLGFAYQICDDIVSIWGEPNMTGKISYNDIREKKKTLPILHMYNSLDDEKKAKFKTIYDKYENLTEDEIEYVKQLLDETNSYDYAWSVLEEHCKISAAAINSLTLAKEHKDKLIEINKALLPNVREVCKC